MLTLDYLRTIIKGKMPNDISKPSTQIIEAAGGYDGIISLIQTKNISPMIILEQSEMGEFSVNPSGFLKTSQSIWVMKMVAKEEDRRKVQDECFDMVKRIIGIFIKRNDEKDPQLECWEWDHIPWGVRNAGANYTGYEFTMHFSEDTDLSYHG